MFDRNLVTSEFDTETLVSESYITYLLLAQIEAGFLPLEIPFQNVAAGLDLTIQFHPPEEYERVYQPDAAAVLPPPQAGSFQVELLSGNASPIELAAFNGDGSQIVSQSRDSQIRLWDADGSFEQKDDSFSINPALGVAINFDADLVATSSFDDNVRLWDTQTGAQIATFAGHTGAVECVAFSADSSFLVSGSFDLSVRVWDRQAGVEVAALTGHTSRIRSVAFSGDGSLIASGSNNGNIRIWDVQNAAEIAILTGHTGPVLSVCFNNDGTKLVSGSEDTNIRVWDIQSGSEELLLSEHSGSVFSVKYNHTNSRIASASGDTTARLWDVANQSQIAELATHRAAVLSVDFSKDDTRLVTASEDGKMLIWDGATGEAQSALRLDFMNLTVFVSVIDNQTGNVQGPLPAVLILNLELIADRTTNGLERNHRLEIAFGRLDQVTQAFLQAVNINPADVEEVIRNQLDREINLGMARGQQVQQIRMKKFVNGPVRSLGFYVDLALRSGPGTDDYLAPRGKIFMAQDFRSLSDEIAFSSSPTLFDNLGPDAKFRQAEEDPPGSGTFRFPLREDPLDPESKKIGRIRGIKVGPELLPPTGIPSGRLMIDVHGEYTDALGDPDFHLKLTFEPKNTAGIVDWDIDVDVDLGLLATIILVVAGIGLTLLFGPGLGWGSTILLGSIMGIAVLKGLIAEPLAAKIVEDRLDEEAQASVLDALPFRVPGARRRWDPFYATEHQLVSILDEPVIIDNQGIAFVGSALTLDKQPEPNAGVTIRDEERVGDVLEALKYRVRNFNGLAPNFSATAPGTDRMDFTRSDPIQAPDLVSLTKTQILDRIAKNRLRAPITYTAERIHLVNNQIDALLCISRVERNEETQRLIREFRDSVRDEIIADDGADITADVTLELEQELGQQPTQEQIDERFTQAVDAAFNQVIEQRQTAYIENDLPADLNAAIAQILSFDLAPEEFAELQTLGILLIDGKEIITRHNADGTTTTYYRDRPDGDPTDNLLALTSYSPPYTPP